MLKVVSDLEVEVNASRLVIPLQPSMMIVVKFENDSGRRRVRFGM